MRSNSLRFVTLFLRGLAAQPSAGALRVTAVFGITCIAASPQVARADDSENFFAQGRQLRSQGKCGEAIVAFKRAFDLKPEGLGSLRNVAECEEEIGQFASARVEWWNLRRAALQSNEPKYAGWDKDAEAAYARLETKVARITVKLTGFEPEKARVTIDGRPLDPRLVGVELERDLGPYTIEVTYGAATPLVDHRTLLAGARETVTLTIPVPKADDGPKVTPVPEQPRSYALRNAGIASLVVGGASFIGMFAAIGVRASALSDFSACSPSYTNCSPSLKSNQSTGQTASALVNVFAVIGTVGVVAGIPMVVVGTRRANAGTSPTSPASPSGPTAATGSAAGDLVFSVAPTTSGGALAIQGKF